MVLIFIIKVINLKNWMFFVVGNGMIFEKKKICWKVFIVVFKFKGIIGFYWNFSFLVKILYFVNVLYVWWFYLVYRICIGLEIIMF